ncbi:hypothetical protein TRAPUB_4630 [Trametes pubescens]|uniref:Uncharacterized protein n=1 Tax=Trametes pubescens TaxID=154538 RepID=A0A1M2W7I7_TRAPU|nr:hypothetical protein TRAPUB_4630 [Trametes pubescens]
MEMMDPGKGKREKFAGRAIVASEAMTRTADCARCRCHGEGDATRLREADDEEAAVQEAAARSRVDSRGPTACHRAGARAAHVTDDLLAGSAGIQWFDVGRRAGWAEDAEVGRGGRGRSEGRDAAPSGLRDAH